MMPTVVFGQCWDSQLNDGYHVAQDVGDNFFTCSHYTVSLVTGARSLAVVSDRFDASRCRGATALSTHVDNRGSSSLEGRKFSVQ